MSRVTAWVAATRMVAAALALATVAAAAPTASAQDDDPRRRAAVVEARATLPDFRTLLATVPGSDGYALLRYDDAEVWVAVASFDGAALRGLVVRGDDAAGMRVGDDLRASADRIIDWRVLAPPHASGAIYGDFGTRAMAQIDPSSVPDSHQARWRPLP